MLEFKPLSYRAVGASWVFVHRKITSLDKARF